MQEITAPVRNMGAKKIVFSVVAALVAFLAYTCVYAYRKPFTAAQFDREYWNVSYQTLLILSQVAGYMLSKFAGIKFISELKQVNRARTGVILVLISWLCLLVFALTPDVVGLACLFVNGFVLGFLWGIIFSYVEGRTTTDFIGAVMAISFIFAGGFTRSAGKWLTVQFEVDPKWMPFSTGLLFILPLLFLFWILEKLPPPDEEDVSLRVKREPMNAEGRRNLIKQFSFGLLTIVVAYVLLTIMRDIRDNYMVNIWTELGYGNDYGILARTETVTSLFILLLMAGLVVVRNNFVAFRIVYVVIGCGLVLALMSSILFSNRLLDGALWMQMVGAGLYMGYIPFNCIFFERMIATFRVHGTAGFLIYFADSFGYLGSTGVMLFKELFSPKVTWSVFYSDAVVISSIVAMAGALFSFIYFNRKYQWFVKQQSL